jgi:ATP-dependent helicase/nuclease subunit B
MMQTPGMYSAAELDSLENALAADGLVLVPNFASSRQLQDQLARRRITRGEGAVQVPDRVLAVDIWLTEIWERLPLLLDHPVLANSILSPLQESLLWERVIARSPQGTDLLDPAGAADNARQAWLLLLQWELPEQSIRRLDNNGLQNTEQSPVAVFGDWAWQFRRQCQTNQVLSFSAMLGLLLDLFASHTEVVQQLLPGPLVLWGFSEPPPLYRRLFATMTRLGVQVLEVPATSCSPVLNIQAYPSTAHEIRAAAQWAAEILEQDATACIGIISPETSLWEESFLRSLHRQVTTEQLDKLPASASGEGFLQTALDLLQLQGEKVETRLLCRLLRSPWLQGAQSEADARARLNWRLRERGEVHVALAELRSWCLSPADAPEAPLLGQALLDFHTALLRAPSRQDLQSWFGFISHFWNSLLDMERLGMQQCRDQLAAWHALQEQVAGIAFMTEHLSLSAALQTLQSVARRLEHSSSQTGSRVQFLGPLAATGLRFTHLWCLQMNERHWPGDARPHPFLPLDLQLQQGMPGCNAAQSLQAAEGLLASLCASTTQTLVYSFALNQGDEILEPTQLLPDLPRTSIAAGIFPPGLHPGLATYAFAACERVEESACLPLPHSEWQSRSQLLERQASCPFKCFAIERLRATDLPAPQAGLPAAAMGTLIHKSLEYLWRDFPDSASLLQMPATQLQTRVVVSIEHALQLTRRDYPDTMKPRYVSLLQESLEALLLQWLDQERKRGPFSILGLEAKLSWQHRGLTLALRIDRVEADAQGHSVIVDYKSGQPKGIAWEAQRQEQPQLLLYAAALEQSGNFPEIAALLHGYVNVDQPGFKGIGIDDNIHPGIEFSTNKQITSPDWSSLKQHWRDALISLADEFLDGHNAVQPLNAGSCQYCHLSSLCRIDELGRKAAEDADADATEMGGNI